VALSRQHRYWNAPGAHSSLLEIRLGRFQQKSKRCFSCGSPWIEYEEKESDVALGAAVVADGARELFDTAVIVSAVPRPAENRLIWLPCPRFRVSSNGGFHREPVVGAYMTKTSSSCEGTPA
jgi:hypothetical protein